MLRSESYVNSWIIWITNWCSSVWLTNILFPRNYFQHINSLIILRASAQILWNFAFYALVLTLWSVQILWWSGYWNSPNWHWMFKLRFRGSLVKQTTSLNALGLTKIFNRLQLLLLNRFGPIRVVLFLSVTHSCLNKLADIFKTKFFNEFSWTKLLFFRSCFNWVSYKGSNSQPPNPLSSQLVWRIESRNWGRGKMAWWRHQMEPFSALLTLCAGNSPVTGEFPAQRPVTRNFDVFFDLRLNKRLSKQSWGWWFETLSRSSWSHCNGYYIVDSIWIFCVWNLLYFHSIFTEIYS